MNKSDLIAKISNDVGIPKSKAEIAINSITLSIKETLIKGGQITLAGLGTFSVSKRATKSSGNYQKGGTNKRPSSSVARFRAGVKLNKKLGGGTDNTGPRKA
jgi:DNA-binding protein HU-beta